jgi:hypothetical protein
VLAKPIQLSFPVYDLPFTIHHSQFTITQLAIGLHFHSVFAKHLTATRMRLTVDGDPTFKADTHSTQRPTRLACDGSSEQSATSQRDCRCHRTTLWHSNLDAIHHDNDQHKGGKW